MAKRALLIGINKYRIPGADLRGCVNDVANVSAVLQDLCGFQKKEITFLTDLAATKRAMQVEIKKLVAGARKGDVIVLHYSGHGSTAPDREGDEADSRDEILCPTDLDWRDPFRDDWLRSTFDGIPEGVNLTVIMDCCYSGTNTRAIMPPDSPVKERYLPSPWDLVAVESGRTLRGKVRRLRRSPASARKSKDIAVGTMPELLIRACRDTQTAADAFVDGAFTGALTYALVQAVREARGDLTYRELHDRASMHLRKKKFEQVPQLEGKKSMLGRRVFS